MAADKQVVRSDAYAAKLLGLNGPGALLYPILDKSQNQDPSLSRHE